MDVATLNAMHFSLVDAVIERSAPDPRNGLATRLVTIKHVSNAEEYLLDHFPGFAVLPGVMMIESAVQAARLLLEPHAAMSRSAERLVLGGVRALKYGRFVRPGDSLRVDVMLSKALADGAYEVKVEGHAVRSWEAGCSAGTAPDGPAAIAGRLVMRPIRMEG
ncbi:MAG: 3-hydroxyacyl-ACP dehydratase FabZ family protein [Phycisphaerales bacterium]